MRRLWGGLLGLVMIALIGAECVGLFGQWLWQGDMITPFRLQMAVAAVALGLLTLPLRKRRLYMLATICLVANLAPMAERLIVRHSLPPNGDGAISVSFRQCAV